MTDTGFQLPRVYAWSALRGAWHLALETYPSEARFACTGKIEPADKFATDPTLVDTRQQWCETCRALGEEPTP